MERRKFLGLSLSAVAFSAANANILKDKPAAFKAKDTENVMKNLYGTSDTMDDGKAKLKAPDIAENGAAVPVTVSTSLENPKTMAITVDGNPHPLVAAWEVQEGTIPEFSTRIKMRKTANVTLVVEDSNGKLHSVTKQVKVTVGGCGG
jgi:sulfur-oxidizing protein SoxY